MIDGFITGDYFYVAKVDQFQHLMRDYRKNVCSVSDERGDQGFSWKDGQLSASNIAAYIASSYFAQKRRLGQIDVF